MIDLNQNYTQNDTLNPYEQFINQILAEGHSQNRSLLIGEFSQSEVEFVQFHLPETILQSPEVYIEDRLMVGKKAQRHIKDGDQPTIEEWKLLAQGFNHRREFYLDVQESKGIILIPSLEKLRVIKIAIQFNFKLKRSKSLCNLARATYKIDPLIIYSDRRRYLRGA